MVILDTSYLYALLREEDDHHQKALQLSKKLNDELVYITFLIFQEFLTLLTGRASSQEAIKVADFLLSEKSPIQLLKIDKEYFEDTLALFKKLSPHRFSFVDVSLIILAGELEAEVITFDKRLEERLGQVG